MARLGIEVDAKKAVSSIRNLDSEIEKFSKSAQKDIDKVGKSSSGLSKTFKTAALGLVAVTAGVVALGVATKIVAQYLKESVDLANEQIKAETKLEAVLQATGHAAGLNIEQLKEMASGLQAVTTVGDEVILNAQAILASFRAIKGEETFKRATEAALNMSAVLGTDLNSSILQVGKALEDPTKGLTALTRSGTVFTESQKDMIKQLQESGDLLGAQGVILNEIEAQYSGVAAALRGTYAGALDAAKNAYGDMKEEIGFVITKNEFLIEVINNVEEQIIKLTTYISENRDIFIEYSKDIAIYVVQAFISLIGVIEQVYYTFKGLRAGAQLALAAITGTVALLAESIRKLLFPLDLVLQALVKMGKIDSNPFDTIIDGAKNMSAEAQEAIGDILDDVNKMKVNFDKARAAGDKVVGTLKAIDAVEVDPAGEMAVNMKKQADETYTALEDRQKGYIEELKKGNEEILKNEQSLQDELRGITREGLTDEQAWKDTIAEIEKYKSAARDAAKAGDWEKQLANLETAKRLISELPKDGVKGIDITDADVSRAKSIAINLLKAADAHSTSSKRQAANEAVKKYNELLTAQKKGADDIVTKQESINKRLELTKGLGEEINDLKGKGTENLEEEAKKVKETMDEYKTQLEEAKTKTEELQSGTATVGTEWERVGGVWTQVSSSMVSDVGKIESALDAAIKKMNELNSKSASTNTSGARASGGPVAGGNTYLVGERGPELFTPNSSGNITSNEGLRRSERGNNVIDINLSLDGSNPITVQGTKQTAEDLERLFRTKEKFAA